MSKHTNRGCGVLKSDMYSHVWLNHCVLGCSGVLMCWINIRIVSKHTNRDVCLLLLVSPTSHFCHPTASHISAQCHCISAGHQLYTLVAGVGSLASVPLSVVPLYSRMWCHHHSTPICSYCICNLPTLVLSLLRHCHSHHGNEDPVANDSDGVMFSCVGVDCRWLVHADNLFSEGLHVMGWTECTKLFLDLRRFVGAIWPYRECLLSVVCFSLSLWEMVLLLIVGGAIPASWYRLSTLVGLRHPVINRHASFSTWINLLRHALTVPTQGMHIPRLSN